MKVATSIFHRLIGMAVAISCHSAAACTPLTRGDAVPANLEEQTVMPGMPGVRFWGDESDPQMLQNAKESFDQERAYLASSGYAGATLPPANFLAISGAARTARLVRACSAAGRRRTGAPAARHAQPIGTSTGHLGFRCVVR